MQVSLVRDMTSDEQPYQHHGHASAEAVRVTLDKAYHPANAHHHREPSDHRGDEPFQGLSYPSAHLARLAPSPVSHDPVVLNACDSMHDALSGPIYRLQRCERANLYFLAL